MKSAALAALAVVWMGAAAQAAETVATAHFNSVELEGGGHVVIRHGAVQSVRLTSGSTAFTRVHVDADEPGKLVIEACNADCPRQYKLEIEIVTPSIDGVAISGGGKIETSGDFPGQHSIAAAVHGGGVVDTRSINAADAKTAVNGGGEIRVKVRDSLVAAVNGGGRIRYWGNPSVTEAVNGGGSVDRGM